MKAKFALAALVALAASGCATYSELSQRPVAYSATTNKTPQAYAECVLPKLLDVSAGSHVVNNGDSRIVVVPVGGGTPDAVMLMLSATPSGEGARVEMRHMASLSGFSKQWKSAQSCL